MSADLENVSNDQLAAMRDELEILETTAKVQQLRAQLGQTSQGETPVGLIEGWGDRVNRREYLYDSPGFGEAHSDPRISRPEDRKFGDNYPHWVTEAEHASIRGIARSIADMDEVAISAMDNLTNYIIGQGMTYSFAPKEGFDKDPDAVRAAKICQRIVDKFIDDNDWEGDLERDLFQQSRRDGEFFLGFQHRGGIHVEAVEIDPSFVTEPDQFRDVEDHFGLPGLEWKYGVAAQHNRPAKVEGFFVEWVGDSNDWDFYDKNQLCHAKINVDRSIKRGLSDFWAIQQNLEAASKLLTNTLAGSAIQAAIAYIREHAPGVKGSQIESFVSGRADQRRTDTTPQGTRVRNARKMHMGTVVDVGAGTKYHAGPLGQPRSTVFVDVVQAALRIVGVRWTMPEYMISGDASNGNFASTLVAEAPFTKSAEAKQSFYKRKFAGVMWQVVKIAATNGIDLGIPIHRLRDVIELAVDAPEIAVRDVLQEAEVRAIENERGILSRKTWAAETNRDYEAEQANIANEPQPTTPDRAPNLAESWRGYP